MQNPSSVYLTQCWLHTSISLGIAKENPLDCFKIELLAPILIGISEYLEKCPDPVIFIKRLPNDASSQNCEPFLYIFDA